MAENNDTPPDPDRTMPMKATRKPEDVDKTVPYQPAIEPTAVDQTVPFQSKGSKKDVEKIIRTGKILTHFQLDKKLGEGGMGTVYLGTDITLDRKTAIKFLNHTVIRRSLNMNTQLSKKERDAAVETIEARFKREAKSAASINHPNLAQIYEANFDTDDWYIAMEYVSGDSLAGLMEKGQAFEVGQIINIFKQTVAGLKYAWDNYKIVHRDIKPANIMVTPEGVVKIVDLGLAKPVGTNQDLPDVTADTETMGTPQYMAPEQARGEEVDFQADIFSLGATLYELCAGQKAFQGNTPAKVYHCQTHKEFEPIQEVRQDTPRSLARLIESMMDPDCKNRPANYDELMREIDLIEGDSSSSITTLVGLVTKEVRRLQSVDFRRMVPWQPFTDRDFWQRPLLYILIIAGLVPVLFLKDSPEPGKISWLLSGVTALLWGALFYKYFHPEQLRRRMALLKAVGLTLAVSVPLVVILGRFDSLTALFSTDFIKGHGLPLWKCIFIAAVVEEVVKLLGVWFLPNILKLDPTHKDYCATGIACGLAFSLKAGIVFSIISWDRNFLTWPSAMTRLGLLLTVTPLLHACWGAISARFIYLARESTKIQVAFIIVGILVTASLHGVWLAFPRTYWRPVIAAVTILLFMASIAPEVSREPDKSST